MDALQTINELKTKVKQGEDSFIAVEKQWS